MCSYGEAESFVPLFTPIAKKLLLFYIFRLKTFCDETDAFASFTVVFMNYYSMMS